MARQLRYINVRRAILFLSMTTALIVSGLAVYSGSRPPYTVSRWTVGAGGHTLLVELCDGRMDVCYIHSYDVTCARAVAWWTSPTRQQVFLENSSGVGVVWRQKDSFTDFSYSPGLIAYRSAVNYPQGRGCYTAIYGSIWVWLLALWAYPACVVVVLMGGRFLRRSRRRRAGLCVDCGYDLYALPEYRCPECGTPFHPMWSARTHPGQSHDARD